MNEEEHEKKYKKAILGLFNAREVEPGIVVHSGKDSPAFIASLVFKMREAFSSKVKIGKPGKKLNFIHTGMLNSNRELIKKEVKKQAKRKKKVLKVAKKAFKEKKKEDSLSTLKRLERDIAELERRI